jgi:hypothetical protein
MSLTRGISKIFLVLFAMAYLDMLDICPYFHSKFRILENLSLWLFVRMRPYLLLKNVYRKSSRFQMKISPRYEVFSMVSIFLVKSVIFLGLIYSGMKLYTCSVGRICPSALSKC